MSAMPGPDEKGLLACLQCGFFCNQGPLAHLIDTGEPPREDLWKIAEHLTEKDRRAAFRKALREAASAVPQRRANPEFFLHCFSYMNKKFPEVAAEMERAQIRAGLPTLTWQVDLLKQGGLESLERDHLSKHPEHAKHLFPHRDLSTFLGQEESFDVVGTPAKWGAQIGLYSGLAAGCYFGFVNFGFGGAIFGTPVLGCIGFIVGFALGGLWPLWLIAGVIILLWNVGNH